MKNLNLLKNHFDENFELNDNLQNYCDIYLDDNYNDFNSNNYKFIKSIRFKKIKDLTNEEIKKVIDLL